MNATMRKHIIALLIALLVLALTVFILRSLDERITMPLLSGAGTQVGLPQHSGDGSEFTGEDQPDARYVDDAAAVDALISAIPTPVTEDSAYAIRAARAAYDALFDNAKAMVTDLSALENAEAALAALSQAGEEQPEEPDDSASQETPGNSSGGAVFSLGDTVTFTGGGVYVSPTATTPGNTIDGESVCKITIISENGTHRYHIISQDGGGVYGWVDASSIRKA